MKTSSKQRPKLRTILFIVNIVVLLLPLGSIYFFRFYENELIRQTESELIAQGSVIIPLYQKLLGSDLRTKETADQEYYQPIPALLDLATARIHPPRPNPMTSTLVPNNQMVATGKNIAPILQEVSRTTLASIRVVERNGIVVASSKGEVGLSFAHVPEVQKALQGQHSSILRERISDEPAPPLSSISRGTGIRVFVTLPITISDEVVGAVLLSRSPKNILKALHDRTAMVFVAIGLLLGVVVLLTAFTSYTITRPIYALIAKAQRIASGKGNERIALTNPITKEVALLSNSLSDMAEALKKRSDYIKQFATHVSHEFKTPLTSIGGAVEILQDHLDELPLKQRERFLKIIEHDTQRLQKLVTRLLELARADVVTPQDENTHLLSVLNALTEKYEALGLTLNVKTIAKDTSVTMATDIVETILLNLLDNSKQKGATKIDITAKTGDKTIAVSLVDNGKGISAANRDKIFTPFFTTHRNKGGTGLGLAIVKSLLQSHGGDISVNPCKKGASFTIKMPTK